MKVFYKCILCDSKKGYDSIEDDLGSILRDTGFPYSLKDFETLSYKKYQCANCRASDRDRLYALFFQKYLKSIKNNKKIKLLDFAPSIPLQKYLKSNHKVQYRSADLMMDTVDDRVDIMDMNIYKDHFYDFFVCSHILEHVKDDTRALKELYRILAKDGQGIIMTPIINKVGIMDEDPNVSEVAERWRRFAQDDHVRLYEKDVFIDRVKAVGFKVKEYTFKDLGLKNFIQNGIGLKSKLYIVSK